MDHIYIYMDHIYIFNTHTHIYIYTHTYQQPEMYTFCELWPAESAQIAPVLPPGFDQWGL